MDADISAGSPPNHILGYTIRSRTRIYVSYLIPSVLELAVYIIQIVADCAVSYQHFHSKQADFGWATLWLILVPPILTFIFVLSSKDQWSNPKYGSGTQFVAHHLLQLLFFPFAAMYKFAVRVFWSIEALFHDDDDKERMLCLARAEECSTCELYHLIQAYGQSAPQIILQLYHMLTQDLFRNFQTTTVQAISLVFSAIDLAAVTTFYQRFESQRQVGRHYPWAGPQEIAAQRAILAKNECLRRECEQRKRDSERTIVHHFPESEKIMENFKLQNSIEVDDSNRAYSVSKVHTVQVHTFDEVDNDADETSSLLRNTQSTLHAFPNGNATDDDKIRCSPAKEHFDSMPTQKEICNINEIEMVLDIVPDCPPPAPPRETSESQPVHDQHILRTQISNNSESGNSMTANKRTSRTFSQLGTFKDMLIVNAQLYIKEHVPRPPKMLINRVDEPDRQQLVRQTSLVKEPSPSPLPSTPTSHQDVVDFFLPRPTKIVNGIQQDDFAGKCIAFFGWIAFIIMRMLALATFCVFFPRAFFIIISIHYVVMLAALHLETQFKDNLNRTLFYMLLAYVYIFVLMEFRIKFKRIRLWFIGYFTIAMSENVIMTIIWYASEEFESWWFEFIFEGIIYSGILFIATILVYYYLLKPKDVTLIVEDNENDNNYSNNNNNHNNTS